MGGEGGVKEVVGVDIPLDYLQLLRTFLICNCPLGYDNYQLKKVKGRRGRYEGEGGRGRWRMACLIIITHYYYILTHFMSITDLIVCPGEHVLEKLSSNQKVAC